MSVYSMVGRKAMCVHHSSIAYFPLQSTRFDGNSAVCWLKSAVLNREAEKHITGVNMSIQRLVYELYNSLDTAAANETRSGFQP